MKGRGMTGRDASGNIWKFGTANMSANASDKNFDLNLFKDDIWVAGITLADALRADAGKQWTSCMACNSKPFC
jgi:hypothetical protein